MHLPMKTAAEYRAMADECFKWAREALDDEVRESYLQLAQVWLDVASKLDGLPAPDPTQASPDAAQISCKAYFGGKRGNE